ncbi:MAG: carboxymuconolactone decarboxylase family protein [Burkholderiales bacterium]|nr:carboxymuconolactone decarboxylase family protein [Burkholderiales bacterium]
MVPSTATRGASARAPRIGGRPPGRYPWYVRLIFAAQRRKYGRELEPARLWGRLPLAFLMLTLLYRALDRAASPIEAELRSLVQVRVSQLNGCGFCVDLNAAAAIERHAGHDKLAALADFERSPLFDARERAALAYAEAMTDPRRGVDDALFARVRGELDEDAVLELTALVAYQNMSSKFNAALGVPAQGFCAAPGAKEDA